MAGRLSQYRPDDEDTRDSLTHQSPEKLFNLADVDHSGKIDFQEFTKLHDLMKGVLEADVKKEVLLKTKANQSKRRLRLSLFLLFVLGVFFIFSTLANAAAMFVIVDTQVTTEANTTSGSLKTKGGHEVSTLQGGREVPLGMLPFMPLYAPTEAMEAAPELIVLKDPDEPLKTTAFKVAAISFVPPKTLEILAASGQRIVIHGACKGHIYPADWAPTEPNTTDAVSAFVNPTSEFAGTDIPGTVTFCAACSTVQLKSMPDSAAMLAARDKFNQAVARVKGDSEEAALCASDLQVGSQLLPTSEAAAKVDSLPSLCHGTGSSAAAARRKLEKMEAARAAQDAKDEAYELITKGGDRRELGHTWEHKCQNKWGWVAYQTPSCSNHNNNNIKKKCCTKWNKCSLRKCLEEGGPSGSMTSAQCKSAYATAKRTCLSLYSSNAYVTDTPAIDAVPAEDEDGSRRSLSVAEKPDKKKRRLASLTAADDGCISLQEMLWNGGSELYASFTVPGTPTEAETTTKICACCEFTHYINSTSSTTDPCVSQGAIGVTAFTTFLNGLGSTDVEDWQDEVDDWDALESAVSDVSVTGTLEDMCDDDAFRRRDRRSLVNGRVLYHSSLCPPIYSTCHPASTLLERADGSTIRIDQVQVGEKIKTQAGFETITSLMHAEHGKPAEFHRFHTADASMAISQGHYLYVNGVPRDPANVKVGEMLMTSCCGEQPIEKIEKTVEEGKFHLNTDSATYYADGVLTSTYVAFVPYTVWKVAGALYPRIRYSLGVPITPEGAKGAVLSIFWLVDVYEAMGMPHWLRGLLWPLTMMSTLFAEILNTIVVQVPMTTTAIALVTSMAKLSRK